MEMLERGTIEKWGVYLHGRIFPFHFLIWSGKIYLIAVFFPRPRQINRIQMMFSNQLLRAKKILVALAEKWFPSQPSFFSLTLLAAEHNSLVLFDQEKYLRAHVSN